MQRPGVLRFWPATSAIFTTKSDGPDCGRGAEIDGVYTRRQLHEPLPGSRNAQSDYLVQSHRDDEQNPAALSVIQAASRTAPKRLRGHSGSLGTGFDGIIPPLQIASRHQFHDRRPCLLDKGCAGKPSDGCPKAASHYSLFFLPRPPELRYPLATVCEIRMISGLAESMSGGVKRDNSRDEIVTPQRESVLRFSGDTDR